MKALVIVDIQNDFCPGGALAVEQGDQVVPVINRLMGGFDVVVATRDWHPPDHGSFARTHGKEVGEEAVLDGCRQILWPVHCVQGTPGAEFVADLKQDCIERVFQKGTDPKIDSYSGFFDNGHKKATGLGDYLQEQGVKEVFIAGLATDYCVRFTALDALRLGFQTHVVADACRAVNLQPGDGKSALQEIRDAGGDVLESEQVIALQ